MQAPDQTLKPLTRAQTHRGLRWMLMTAALWGAYTPIAQVTGAIFTGFALWLGATESKIAVLSAMFYLAGIVQPFSFFLTNRLQNKKRFLVLAGSGEIVLVLSVVAIPLVFPEDARVTILMAMVLLGMASSNLLLPTYNSWMSSLIPSDVRGRYLSRRTALLYGSMIVCGYAASRFIDAFPPEQRYRGFACVFVAGMVAGVSGYLAAGRAPFVAMDKVMPVRLGQLFRVPFADRGFGLFLLFYMCWVIGAGFSIPFVNVYCLRQLGLSYGTIAVFANISLATMVVAYQLWGHVADTLGAKRVLQLGMIPRAIIPFVWALVTPENCGWLIPSLMVLSGLTFSGVTVAFNALLYDIVPGDQRKPAYFASWGATISVAGTATYLLSGWLVNQLTGTYSLAGLTLSHLQVMFLISAALLVVPNVVLLFVPEPRATKPGHTWGVIWRGNPLAFVASTFAFSHAATDADRAEAARKMGRSRSPMAIDPLVRALEDPSFQVRREAAKGLGESRYEQAVAALAQQLDDDESDIRAEAAEALGHIARPEVLDPLLRAAQSPDTRVRISAIRALAGMGGNHIRDVLFGMFIGPFDRASFPTLAEALSHFEDVRIVSPTMEALARFHSPVIKIQLLQCVCRALGAGNLFYNLMSVDDLSRPDRLSRLLQRRKRQLRGRRGIPQRDRRALEVHIDEVLDCLETEQTEAIRSGVLVLAARIQACSDSPTVTACWEAISAFWRVPLRTPDQTHVLIDRAEEVFPVVCLRQALRDLV